MLFLITQIYSIISVEEALQCVEAGSDYIGVLVEDAGRGCPCAVPLETAADIFRALAGKATRVMIPASDREENILHYARTAQPDIVHLSSSFKSSAAFQAKLEAALPGAKIMQAIGMSGPEAYDEALQRQKYADYLLLDSVSPNTQNGGIGAVGVPHDWSISKKSSMQSTSRSSWPAAWVLTTSLTPSKPYTPSASTRSPRPV